MKKRRQKREEDQHPRRIEQEELPAEVERRICYCFGRLHKLLVNCLSCGKVICEGEGGPDCLFCHQPIDSMEETDLVSNQFLEKAIADRQRLLEFQQGSTSRKNVIDDQNDWYDLKHNLWESREVRKLAEEKEAQIQGEKDRQKQFITYEIDLKSGTVRGKEVVADVGAEKEQVRQFMEAVQEKDRKQQKRDMVANVVQAEEMRAVVEGIKMELTRDNQAKPAPSAAQAEKRTVQNDDAFDVLLEFGKAMRGRESGKS